MDLRILEELRSTGRADTDPVWIEALPPEEALEELSERSGPLFRLQEARFLSLLGRTREARTVLGRLLDLPAGLDRVRRELLGDERLDSPDGSERDAPLIASKTLAALYAKQGDLQTAEAAYREVLRRDPHDEDAAARLAELRTTRNRVDPKLRLQELLGKVTAWRSRRDR